MAWRGPVGAGSGAPAQSIDASRLTARPFGQPGFPGAFVRTLSSVDGAYPGEFAEARLGIAAQDASTGLSRVGGDDQVVRATRGTGPADMGEQATMVSRGRLRVVKDIDS